MLILAWTFDRNRYRNRDSGRGRGRGRRLPPPTRRKVLVVYDSLFKTVVFSPEINICLLGLPPAAARAGSKSENVDFS